MGISEKLEKEANERYNQMHKGFQVGLGKNKGDKPGAGPGGNCICPSCGATVPHSVNEPCNQKKCPKCGTTLTRK